MNTPPFQVMHLLPDISRGGGQAVVLELVANCDRARFQPHVARLAAPDDMAAEFTAAGCVPIDPRERGPGLLGGLVRTIGDLGIDLLHVHSERDRKLGQIAALLRGCRLSDTSTPRGRISNRCTGRIPKSWGVGSRG
ncbi:MAG: hypothetical protein M5U19_00700 [Microthrixaceae bacterium]|nr:hypothetical protein [Microthrixaceae bacterium]